MADDRTPAEDSDGGFVPEPGMPGGAALVPDEDPVDEAPVEPQPDAEQPAESPPEQKRHKTLGDIPGMASIPGMADLSLPGGMSVKDLPALKLGPPDKHDPLDRLKRVIGYMVLIVWAVTFVANIILGRHDSTALLAVQALMMMVAGAVYADNLRGKDG